MCFDPVTMAVIGGTAMAGGTGLQMFGKGQQQKAYEERIRAERERQAALAEEARQLFERSTAAGGAEGFKGRQADAVADRTASYKSATSGPGAASTPTAVTTGSAGAAPSIRRATSHANSTADRFVEALIKSSAKMGGANDAFASGGRDMFGNRLNMGLTANKAAGSLSVLPVELQDAKSKGGLSTMFGDLLTGLGSKFLMSGAGGGFGGASVAGGAGQPGIPLDAAGRILGGI